MRWTRLPSPEEIRDACVNSEATWDSCRDPDGLRQALSSSFGHVGRDGAPDLHFHFEWDGELWAPRVTVTAPGCSGCRWSHRFRRDEAVWSAAPPPPWAEACELVCEALRTELVAEVMES